jgi:Ca2+-binding EF-hand superfamily protein
MVSSLIHFHFLVGDFTIYKSAELLTSIIPYTTDYSTDEEYQKIIAGEYGEEDADEDERIKRQFELADVDGSGHISLTEFLKMSRDLQQQREGEGGSLIAPTFASRIEELERRQQEQGLKIDRILKLLESKYMP